MINRSPYSKELKARDIEKLLKEKETFYDLTRLKLTHEMKKKISYKKILNQIEYLELACRMFPKKYNCELVNKARGIKRTKSHKMYKKKLFSETKIICDDDIPTTRTKVSQIGRASCRERVYVLV